MVTYKFYSPAPVDLSGKTVSALTVTAVTFSTTPNLAPVGTGELSVLLTDPVSGWQTTVMYKDASVLSFFAQEAPAPPSGSTVQDVMAHLVFTKLIADHKLPAGAVTTA